MAGGVGQRRLAEKHGLSYAALRRRAETEGWVALRRERRKAAEKQANDPAQVAEGSATGNIPAQVAEISATGNNPARVAEDSATGNNPAEVAEGSASGNIPARVAEESATGNNPAQGDSICSVERQRNSSARDRMRLQKPSPVGEGGICEANDGRGPSATEQMPSPCVPSPDPQGDSGIALRLRRKLLTRLEKMADEIPDGAVTEYKTQDDSAVKLFKLRDLTAAYKELAGDIPAEDGEAARVIIDV